MRVAVIIPAHNEASVLDVNARLVWEWGKGNYETDFALVISENGSSDSTPWLARLLEKLLPGCLALSSKEPGKGGAIKRAAKAVEADVYLMLDADLSADLVSAQALIKAVDDGADLAIGSRRMPKSQVERPWVRRLTTAAYAGAADAALGLGVRDLQCGCKAFSRKVRDEILPLVADDGWFFDTELLAKSRRAGARIIELGIRWTETAKRESKVRILPTGLAFLRRLAELRRELG